MLRLNRRTTTTHLAEVVAATQISVHIKVSGTPRNTIDVQFLHLAFIY